MTQPFIFRCQGHCNDERSALTFQHTDWTALLAEARILNGGRHCIYDGSYYAGGRHIVRRLKFVDGNDLWLVHIPIITASSSSDQNGISKWWTATRQFTMESEIATMIHYTEAGASVPKIFGYNTSVDGNPVRLPYMIMYCIPGNMLYNLGGFDVLTMEQKIKIRKSIASIQCQMAAALIGKLGSLVLGTDGVVDVGPLPASFGFEGPFNSVSDYFLSWSRNSTFGKPDFLLTHHDDNDWLRKLKQDVASFPSRLKTIIEKGSLKNLSSRNRYPILNRDFLPRNMLFDDEFNIVGVIDWEGAHSAPIEVFAALTNMYSRFDPETLHMVPDSDDGRRYIEDVKDKDRETGQALSERRLEACSAISVPI